MSTINHFNKVNQKEDLKELLKRYKRILNDSMIDYLESLINLEFSVLKENITMDERILLSELAIYQKIATYNIYNKTLLFFKSLDIKDITNLKFNYYQTNNERLNIYCILDTEYINLFDFYYGKKPQLYQIPRGYKTMKIGEITLYRILKSKNINDTNYIDKLEIEISNYIYRLLIQEYGLSDILFETKSISNKGQIKTYRKSIPNLTINNNITYI